MKKSVAMIMVLVVICYLFASCYSINVPVVVPTNNPVGSKVGKASGVVWFGAFGTADASIQAAMENGNITTVSTVEFVAHYRFFKMFQSFTVTVTGE